MKALDRIILGTANIGMPYGVTNNSIFNSLNSKRILKFAAENGIHLFDTSPDYGSAEEMLGDSFRNSSSIQVITKIPRMDVYTFNSVYNSLLESLEKLGKETLHGVLFHDPEAYKEEILDQISGQILDSGITQKIGFSAYSLEDLIAGKKSHKSWNLFQIPENIVDRRKLRSSELMEMSNSGDTILVRSAFLQGLLLLKEKELNSRFANYSSSISDLSVIAKSYGVTVLDLCMSYADRIPWSSATIIGAASEAQLLSIINYVNCDIDFEDIPALSPHLLDPRKW